MKEVRRIEIDKVRSMCIRNNYYTLGTCEEYAAMFELCRTENPTTQNFEEIAIDILGHSDAYSLTKRTGLAYRELLKCVMFELINDCTIVHIED